MRLIDADALKEVICDNVYPVTDYINSRDYGMFWTGGIEKAIDEAPTINEKKIIKDFLLKCSKICNDDCDKCPMYIQRAYDEKLCFFDFFDNFQFLDNVRKMDDVITGVLDYEVN